MEKKIRKFLKIFFVALLVFTLIFIWSNSLKSREVSKEQSVNVTGWLNRVLSFAIKSILSHEIVRKLAHFVEFGALGFELMILCRLYSMKKIWYVNIIFISMVCALTDETLQIFSGRGPLIKDVWLDTAGTVFGMLFAFAVCLIISEIAGKNKKRMKSNVE